MPDYKIIVGDCIEAMKAMPDCSIDAIVTDPPYGIDFMNKSWDKPGEMVGTALGISGGFQKFPPGVKRPEYKRSDPHIFQLWCEAWAVEALRVLKPGGHLLAFGGTRMYHRLASGIEDAGFEIRDCIQWLYGSGFPKSHNVALSIDKMMGHDNRGKAIPTASTYQASDTGEKNRLESNPVPAYEAKSDEAQEWDGWGTALKPANEPIVVARKPMNCTVAKCVLEHGTGALNIDACRIGVDGGGSNCRGGDDCNCQGKNQVFGATRHAVNDMKIKGRWPANIILDDEAAKMLDAQSGTIKSGSGAVKRKSSSDNDGNTSSSLGAESRPSGTPVVCYGDSGGASRFFYVVKPSRKEREAGLHGHNPEKVNDGRHVDADNGYQRGATKRKNIHPTVKPIKLMRYLVRLVTPPGGTVLDPFTGSGTTGIAALLEGFGFIGCEMSDEYADIAESRISHWTGYVDDDIVEVEKIADSDQQQIF